MRSCLESRCPSRSLGVARAKAVHARLSRPYQHQLGRPRKAITCPNVPTNMMARGSDLNISASFRVGRFPTASHIPEGHGHLSNIPANQPSGSVSRFSARSDSPNMSEEERSPTVTLLLNRVDAPPSGEGALDLLFGDAVSANAKKEIANAHSEPLHPSWPPLL